MALRAQVGRKTGLGTNATTVVKAHANRAHLESVSPAIVMTIV